jgi:hypothetical protein
MAKPNPLSQGLTRAQRPSMVESESVAPAISQGEGKRVVPSRAGRVLIGGHFAPEVQMALKILAAEERTTVQALLAEAINLVLARHGKPEIAGLTTR